MFYVLQSYKKRTIRPSAVPSLLWYGFKSLLKLHIKNFEMREILF